MQSEFVLELSVSMVVRRLCCESVSDRPEEPEVSPLRCEDTSVLWLVFNCRVCVCVCESSEVSLCHLVPS